MARHSCCYKQKLRKGLWSPEEDEKLLNHITQFGHGCWSSVPKLAGLQRCGKSCRLRWINYLRPDLKRGAFSDEEEGLIVELHAVLGNRYGQWWSQIAAQLPGRTDNEIKNFWNSSLKKKLKQKGIDPNTHKPLPESAEEKKSPIAEDKGQLFPDATHYFPSSDTPFCNPFPFNARKVFDTSPDLLHMDTMASILPPLPGSIFKNFVGDGVSYWDAGSSSISSGNSSSSADLQSNASFFDSNTGSSSSSLLFDEFKWSELLHSNAVPMPQNDALFTGEIKAENHFEMDDGYVRGWESYYDDDLTRISATFREL